MYDQIFKNLFGKAIIDGTFLPIFYLRDKEDWGIGDINGLKKAVDLHYSLNKNIIEILPLNYSSAFESPYSVLSSKLLNSIYISPIMLLNRFPFSEAELFIKENIKEISFLKNSDKVLYEKVRVIKNNFFKIIYKNFLDKPVKKDLKTFYEFKNSNKDWIFDHALFKIFREKMINQNPNTGWDFRTWPLKIRKREEKEILKLKNFYKNEIDFEIFLQWVFMEQWKDVRIYAQTKNIAFMGDIPFSVDGADIWINPEIFGLKSPYFRRDFTQGVPPDFFSPFGQYWQFYSYDWNNKKTLQFLIERFEHHQKLFSVIRLDHVLGYYRSFLFYEDPDKKFTFENLKIWDKVNEIILKAKNNIISQGNAGWEIYKIILDSIRKRKINGKELKLSQFFSKDNNYSIAADQMLLVAKNSMNGKVCKGWVTQYSVERAIQGEYPMINFLRISEEKKFQDHNALSSYLFTDNECSIKKNDSIRPCFFVKGPGENLMKKFLYKAIHGNTILIAEALGIVPEYIFKSLDKMKIINYIPLIYGLTPLSPNNLYFPKNHQKNAFVTFSLHDSETLYSWWINKTEKDKQDILDYLFTDEKEKASNHNEVNYKLHLKLLSKVYESKAFIKVLIWTDIFLTNNDDCINKPGSQMGQWISKMPKDSDIDDLLNALKNQETTEKAKYAITLLKDLKKNISK